MMRAVFLRIHYKYNIMGFELIKKRNMNWIGLKTVKCKSIFYRYPFMIN